jgi:hypothetical protein
LTILIFEFLISCFILGGCRLCWSPTPVTIMCRSPLAFGELKFWLLLMNNVITSDVFNKQWYWLPKLFLWKWPQKWP